jgi:hypothetical protein
MSRRLSVAGPAVVSGDRIDVRAQAPDGLMHTKA